MKTYHFLAGLPRTGNTVLGSLLNQNPLIYVSPISPIPSYLYNLEYFNNTDENTINFKDKKPLHNVKQNVINNFYQNIDKPIVIDRNKAWGTLDHFFNAQQSITLEPKIIFTIRPIIEILTSFMNILPDNSYLDTEMARSNWWYKNYLTKNDNRCDYLMRPYGQIDLILTTINQITNPEYKDNFCLIQYDEIVNTPDNAMKKIYEFLGLPNYKHDFNNIVKLETEDTTITYLPPDLHNIRPQLNKVSKDPKEVLSEYVINKYSNIGWEA